MDRIGSTPSVAPRLRKRRACNEEDKRLRRSAILAAARAAFMESSYARFSMADVAARAGIVKGTLYLYFRTKEELLFALFEELELRWLDDFEARLARERRLVPARVADIYVRTLARHEPLARLLTVLQTMLEYNVAAAVIRRFKRTVTARMLAIGGRLERALPGLRKGEGRRVLIHAASLAIGLKQLADPAPTVAAIHDEPEFRAHRLDFDRELRRALETYFSGIAGAGRTGSARQARRRR